MKREEITHRLLQEAPDKRLPCQKAFEIAAELDSSTEEIGALCDELKIKIIGCRLGCF